MKDSEIAYNIWKQEAGKPQKTYDYLNSEAKHVVPFLTKSDLIFFFTELFHEINKIIKYDQDILSAEQKKKIFKYRDLLMQLDAYFPEDIYLFIVDLPKPVRELLHQEVILRNKLQHDFYNLCIVLGNKNLRNSKVYKKLLENYKKTYHLSYLEYKENYGFDGESSAKIHDLAIRTRFNAFQKADLANVYHASLYESHDDDNDALIFGKVEQTFDRYREETSTHNEISNLDKNLENFVPIQRPINSLKIQSSSQNTSTEKAMIVGAIALGAGILFALPAIPVLVVAGLVAGALLGGSMAKIAEKFKFFSQKKPTQNPDYKAAEISEHTNQSKSASEATSPPASPAIPVKPREQIAVLVQSPDTPSLTKSSQFSLAKTDQSNLNTKRRYLLPFFNQASIDKDASSAPPIQVH